MLIALSDQAPDHLSQLARNLSAPREATRQAVRHLQRQGALQQLTLTDRGQALAQSFRALYTQLDRMTLHHLARRKWPLPVLTAVGAGIARFAQIKQALPGATDRAVTLALTQLRDEQLVMRAVVTDASPPHSHYLPHPRATPLLPLLTPIMAAQP